MSLLFHQDEDESLLKVDGDRLDSEGRLLPEIQDIHSPRSEAPSRPETPHDAGPKKKISLKDYQKARSSANTPDRKPEQDLRKQAMKSHKEEQLKKTPELQPVQKVEQKQMSRVPVVKSPARVEVKTEPSNAAATQHDRESQRPAKKRRLSTEEDEKKPTPKISPVKTESKPKKEVAAPEPEPIKEKVREKRPMPDMISPILPAESAKKQKTKDLPELLGPDLPPELSLERLSSDTPHRSNEVKSILRGIVSPGRERSNSQHRPGTPNIKVSSPALKPATAATRPGTPLTNGHSVTPVKTASPRPRQRHIIVLKYGKKNRKRVEMLLKFEPRRKKESSATAVKEPVKVEEKPDKPASAKSVPKTESAKLEKKRPAESEPDVPAKRPKLEPPIKPERPTTPAPDLPKKPLSAFSTPKKELKSSAMQRVMSTDTMEPGTPGREVPRTSTPTLTRDHSQSKTSPGPISNPAKSEDLTWTDITNKIFQLGRVLKKEGQKLAGEGTGKDKAKGVILLIEGLLCFMLNAGAQAQARPSGDPGWSTILPYYTMVYKQSRPYKHLNGLVVQLGAVCRQHLHHEHIRRLSKETFPDDTVSAPTPGSDGNTRSPSSTTSNNRKRFSELRDELVSNSRELRHAWLEGSKLLPVEMIESDYTGTWRKRIPSKDIAKRSPDKLDPKHLPKDFPMPLDVTTNVFEASNFALAFMREWAMIEQIDWKTRIDL